MVNDGQLLRHQDQAAKRRYFPDERVVPALPALPPGRSPPSLAPEWTAVDRFYAGVRRGGFHYGEEGRLFDITGVPDERIAVRVDTRAVRDRKWAAILRHRTQLDEHERIPEPLRGIVLDAECFVQAFPPARRPAAAVHDDLLAGLDPEEAGVHPGGGVTRWPPRRWSAAPWSATW